VSVVVVGMASVILIEDVMARVIVTMVIRIRIRRSGRAATDRCCKRAHTGWPGEHATESIARRLR
jgi:hypothetical protein